MSEPDPVIPPRFKGVGIRLLTAIGLVLLCIAPFYIGGWVWALLVGLLSSRMMYEWVRMADPESGPLPICIAIGGLVVALIYAVQGYFIGAMVAVFVVTFIAVLERLRRGPAFWKVIGLPYVIIPAVLIVMLRGSDVGFATQGFTQLVFIILIVVASDAGAYFVGSQFGGPKLAPKLSPNKTWSGAIGGTLLAILVAIIAGLFIGLSPLTAIAFALPLSIISVLGDLLESTFKRRLGVKDTGTLLPGHGGLLDRLDSLMAAVVGGAILLHVFGYLWPTF